MAKKKKKSKKVAPHVKAFAVKAKLDIELFNTNIVTFQCDRRKHWSQFGTEFEPKSVVVAVVNAEAEEKLLKKSLEEIDCEKIDVLMFYKGSEEISKYLDGDF
jgi:hypothetical protein